MKRTITLVTTLAIVALAAIGIFNKPKSNIAIVKCPEAALLRSFIQNINWQPNNATALPNGTSYHLQNNNFNSQTFTLKKNNQSFTATVAATASTDTTCTLTLYPQQSITTGFFYNLSSFFGGNVLTNQSFNFLHQIANYYSAPKNVYGFTVQNTTVPYPHLISTKITDTAYPTTTTIYNQITQLQQYVASNKCTQLDSAMLHVYYDAATKQYQTMVALPIAFALQAKNNITPKFMIQGALLKTTVTGGTQAIQAALKNFEYYLNDYKLSSPAIPYQTLNTYRLNTDSNQWVTNLYFPVFKKQGF
jgi:hypothetical protein